MNTVTQTKSGISVVEFDKAAVKESLKFNNPYQDARTLNAIHCKLDMVYQELFLAMTGEQRLNMDEALKDLRRMADKLETSEEF